MGTKSTISIALQADSRVAMIAEAAYFAAERRNFEPGKELSDWLAAEQQIAATTGSVRKPRTRKPAKKTAKKKTAKAR